MPLQDARGGYRRLRNKRPSQGSVTRRRSSPPFPRISRLTGKAGQSNIIGRLFRNASHSPPARLVANIEIRGAGRGSRYFHAWAFISQTADSFAIALCGLPHGLRCGNTVFSLSGRREISEFLPQRMHRETCRGSVDLKIVAVLLLFHPCLMEGARLSMAKALRCS